MTASRIADRRYQRYDGPRGGPSRAQRTLVAHTLRRILGLRRPARTKILPVASIVFAYLPAVVFIGVVALFGKQVAARAVPSYADYYSFIVSAILLFVTLVAPEALCPDRRHRTLSLYLAAPLTRMTYLAAKAAAVFAVLCSVTVGPTLLLLLGRVAQGSGPDGPLQVLLVLGRILLSGVLVAAVFTSVSIGVASLTDRRAVAAGATLALLVGSNVTLLVLVEVLHASRSILTLSLTYGPFVLVSRIHGARFHGGPGVPGAPAALAGALFWVLVPAAVAVWRYRSLRVTR